MVTQAIEEGLKKHREFTSLLSQNQIKGGGGHRTVGDDKCIPKLLREIVRTWKQQ